MSKQQREETSGFLHRVLAHTKCCITNDVNTETAAVLTNLALTSTAGLCLVNRDVKHHIEETDAGLDRPLYLRNKLYDKTLKSQNYYFNILRFPVQWRLPCGYTIPLG